MGALAFEHHLLKEAGTSPNNGALPLIVYRGAIGVGGDEPEAAVERHFDANGWGDGFRGEYLSLSPLPLHRSEVVAVRAGRRSSVRRDGGAGWSTVSGDAVLIPRA